MAASSQASAMKVACSLISVPLSADTWEKSLYCTVLYCTVLYCTVLCRHLGEVAQVHRLAGLGRGHVLLDELRACTRLSHGRY